MGWYASSKTSLRAAFALILLLGCVAAPSSSSNCNGYCAQHFDQLDGFDRLPALTAGFDFRQMQIARIRQGNCITFTRDLAGMETLSDQALGGQSSTVTLFARSRAVQAGVVTKADDVSRGMTFFANHGFRSRAVGYAGLGTRLYVEAHAASDIQRIVVLAQQAGFVGPYLSRYVLF